MNIGSKVALRDFPQLTGTVVAIDNEDGMANVSQDGTGIRQQSPIEELIEITEHELPDDKSWPPSGMETKDT